MINKTITDLIRQEQIGYDQRRSNDLPPFSGGMVGYLSYETVKWYEKISFRYVGEMRNTFAATDTTLFTQQTLDDARYGIRHTVTPSMSFTVAKYFNVTPNDLKGKKRTEIDL